MSHQKSHTKYQNGGLVNFDCFVVVFVIGHNKVLSRTEFTCVCIYWVSNEKLRVQYFCNMFCSLRIKACRDFQPPHFRSLLPASATLGSVHWKPDPMPTTCIYQKFQLGPAALLPDTPKLKLSGTPAFLLWWICPAVVCGFCASCGSPRASHYLGLRRHHVQYRLHACVCCFFGLTRYMQYYIYY